MLQTDRPNYIALIRHNNVFLCAIRALAESFFVRFVLHDEPYPNPADEEDW